MPAMTPADLHEYLAEHFPQVAHFDLKVPAAHGPARSGRPGPPTL